MFRINEADYEATKAKVDKISERAIKRGFTGSVQLTAERIVIESVDEFGFNRTDIWFDVEITGEPPKYYGWTFLATLDWDLYAGLIVRSAPGAPTVDRAQLKENHCDHCETVRTRNKTYLVMDENGRQLQVGSTCIKDFLGWATSIVFLDTASITSDLAFGVGLGRSDCVGTDYALAVAWALIKLDGYRPASACGGTTKGDVISVLWPSPTMTMHERNELARIRELAAEAAVRAAECRAWVASDDFAGDGDYVRNLKNIVAADYVSIRNIGFLASAPQAWARAQQATLIREARPTSEWIGKAGEKVTFTAKIEGVRFIHHDFGVKVLYSMRTTKGDVVKWFASRDALGDETGREVTLKATIKTLETFHDVQQTVIVRAKEVALAA